MDPSQTSIQDGKTLHPYDRASEKLFSVSMVPLACKFLVSFVLWRHVHSFCNVVAKFRTKLVVKMDQLDSRYIYLIFKANTDLNMLDIRILVHCNAGRVGQYLCQSLRYKFSGDFKIQMRFCFNILIPILDGKISVPFLHRSVNANLKIFSDCCEVLN